MKWYFVLIFYLKVLVLVFFLLKARIISTTNLDHHPRELYPKGVNSSIDGNGSSPSSTLGERSEKWKDKSVKETVLADIRVFIRFYQSFFSRKSNYHFY